MREGRLAASVIGVVSACLIGGGAVAYKAMPQTNTKDDFVVVRPADDEMPSAAKETSVKTITANSSAKKNNRSSSYRAARPLSYETKPAAATTTTTTVTTVIVTETVTTTVTTEAPTEPETVPTEACTEAEEETYYYEEPVYAEQNEEPEYTEPETEPYSEEAPIQPEPEAQAQPTDDNGAGTPDNSIKVSDSDYILLCNVVANEAGSYWVSEYDKALVVEVVMNRVNSPLFPNTVYGVLTQPYQFSGCGSYVNLGTFSWKVTDSVKNAVNLYLSDPTQFSQGYLWFSGDGTRNYFRVTY